MENQPFKNNVVVLTGASMGIGEQLAYQLARQGAKLTLVARTPDKLARVATECERLGAKVLVIPADLTDEIQCQNVVVQTVGFFGRLDTLLYNAGRGYPALFQDLQSVNTIKQEITLNYLGLVHCCFYALPHLRKHRGRIVAVSSLGSLVGLPGTIGYNSSKYALRGFLNTLRAELLGSGVTITVVFPGAVRTQRLEETMGQNIDKVPTMSPEDCAQLIIRAGAKRQRQLIMTISGKLMVFLYQVFPGLIDRLLARLGSLYQNN